MEGTAHQGLHLKESIDVCADYQAELQKKADLKCQQKAGMSDTQKLAKDVHHLAEEIQKACLMKKWGSNAAQDMKQKELPEDRTYQLCTEIMEDQDLITDMVQGLQQQQSHLDSEIAKGMSELKGYYVKT